MFANPSVEQISAEALRELQLTRLQKQLRWAGEKCSHYRESFAEAGVSAKEVQELDALQNFPLLPRGVLQGKNAFDFLTMPLSSLLRISYMHSGQDEDNVFVHLRPTAILRIMSNR